MSAGGSPRWLGILLWALTPCKTLVALRVQPDRAVEDVLERIFRIKDPAFKGIAPLALEQAAAPERPPDAEAITP